MLLRGGPRVPPGPGTRQVCCSSAREVSARPACSARLATFARQTGVAVLSGRAPIVTPAPFSVFTEALRSWLRGHDSPGPMRAVRPWARARSYPSGRCRMTRSELDGPQLHLLALEGIARFVARHRRHERRARSSLLDDMHAADVASLEAMRHLDAGRDRRRRNRRRGAFRRIAARGRAGASLADATASRRRRDRAARRERCRRPGRRAARRASARRRSSRDIVGRTDGVPLLVEEVVLAHVRAGTVEVRRRSDHVARWRRHRAQDHPRARRCSSRAVSTRSTGDVVVAGAVVGDFEPALMRRGRRGRRCASSATRSRRGVRAGLLETSGGVIAFRHAIIREAVLDATVPHVVDTLHRRAAAALDRASGVRTVDADRARASGWPPRARSARTTRPRTRSRQPRSAQVASRLRCSAPSTPRVRRCRLARSSAACPRAQRTRWRARSRRKAVGGGARARHRDDSGARCALVAARDEWPCARRARPSRGR